MKPSAATTWVCSPHGTRVVQEDEPKFDCAEADRSPCTWERVPTAARVSRAEMVRREFGYGPRADVARAALDSLLAERENYRLALQRIENVAADEEVEYEDACDKVWKLAFDALQGGGPVGR